MAGAGGQVMGGTGGPSPMGGDLLGGLGGGPPPGGPPPAGMPMDMGAPPPMGAPPGGDLGLGAPPPGAAPPPPGAPAGGAPPGLGASASTFPNKIFKRGKAPKQEEVKPAQPKQIYLTKPEQKLASILGSLAVPYPLFAQFQQFVPGQRQPYLLDFAYPQIGVDVEADGEFWHSDPEAIERDRARDMRLAQLGWRVIRIKEGALNAKVDEVSQIILSNVREAIEERRILSKTAAFLSDGEPQIISTDVADIFIPSRLDGEVGDTQDT